MRNIYSRLTLIALFVLFLYAAEAIAQSSATVYTPKGTAVPALVFSEFTAAEITNINNQAAAQYPNAQRIDNASAVYNCHAYAWYLSESVNSPRYWINTPGDDSYWNDGSYIQVCNVSEATKISYASDDHSAIRSSVAGKYDSKWGQYPLLRHDPTYTPYNSTTLRYYVSTRINKAAGCNKFSAAFITGATYTWSSSTLTITPSTNNVTVSGTNGMHNLSVQIVSPCGGTVTTTQSVRVGPDPVTFSSFLVDPYLYRVKATASHPSGGPYRWYVDGVFYTESFTKVDIPLPRSCNVGYNIKVEVISSCGTVTNTRNAYISCEATAASSLAVYPNPASDEFTVEAAPTSEQTEFHIQLYSKENQIVRTGKSKNKKISVDTKQLPEGIYYLHVVSEKGTSQHQIIIQR